MTLPTLIPTNTNMQTARKRLAPLGDVASDVGRIFRGAAADVGIAIVIFTAYRAALKRLEAKEHTLFDEPVLWAEIKSVAWAEAGEVAEQWKDRLPLIRVCAFGAGFLRAIAVAALWTQRLKMPSSRRFTSISRRLSIPRSWGSLMRSFNGSVAERPDDAVDE